MSSLNFDIHQPNDLIEILKPFYDKEVGFLTEQSCMHDVVGKFLREAFPSYHDTKNPKALVSGVRGMRYAFYDTDSKYFHNQLLMFASIDHFIYLGQMEVLGLNANPVLRRNAVRRAVQVYVLCQEMNVTSQVGVPAFTAQEFEQIVTAMYAGETEFKKVFPSQYDPRRFWRILSALCQYAYPLITDDSESANQVLDQVYDVLLRFSIVATVVSVYAQVHYIYKDKLNIDICPTLWRSHPEDKNYQSYMLGNLPYLISEYHFYGSIEEVSPDIIRWQQLSRERTVDPMIDFHQFAIHSQRDCIAKSYAEVEKTQPYIEFINDTAEAFNHEIVEFLSQDLAKFYANLLPNPMALLQAAQQLRNHVLQVNHIKLENYEKIIEKDARVYLSGEKLKLFNDRVSSGKGAKWLLNKLAIIFALAMIVLMIYAAFQ